MSTGRHARKRAAQAEERLAGQQEKTLQKEEAKKNELQKDLESQRIATFRTRFGGQAPEVIGDQNPNTSASQAANTPSKFKTPARLSTSDPMRKTVLGMMLDDDQR